MEIRQLEYFVTACEQGSLNRAAEQLYTSQPNVSKVIACLEKELGNALFERTSRGIRLTEYGESVYGYASNILKNASIISSLGEKKAVRKFGVSSYASNMVSRILTDFYNKKGEQLTLEHQQGTVEEITDNVERGISEIGILYVSQKHLQAFQHIVSHKKLEFVPLIRKEACVYVGPCHPLYNQESIDFSELPNLRFVCGLHDYFSMEHHLEHVSVGAISTEHLNQAVHTNSEHLSINLLLHTDICSLGIDFMCSKYQQFDIKSLKINNCEPFLILGYVYQKEQQLSIEAAGFIEQFKSQL